MAATYELPKPGSGLGTEASPWDHADGLGGFTAALAASRTSVRVARTLPGHVYDSGPGLVAVAVGQVLPESTFTDRRTSGSSNDLLAEMAALHSDGYYTRSTESADLTLVENTHTRSAQRRPPGSPLCRP